MLRKVPKSWHRAIGAEFDRPYFKSLAEFVDEERRAFPSRIYPSEEQVFAAFSFTPFESTNVLLLGQDPYPGEGMAHGLCFSVRPDVRKIPASLKNIFKELHSDTGLPIPDNGCLVPWAKQGVLLLNAILTLRAGQPLSHKGRGWETFTDEVIRQMNARNDRIIFVFWGGPARKKASFIDRSRHVVIEGVHPSPLSAKGFFGTRPFSRINAALREAGKPEIDWSIPNLGDPS